MGQLLCPGYHQVRAFATAQAIFQIPIRRAGTGAPTETTPHLYGAVHVAELPPVVRVPKGVVVRHRETGRKTA